MSKVITIHRVITFAQMAHTEPDVQTWFSDAFRGLGPIWGGKSTYTGLSHKEQRLLMPHLHQTEYTDKDFRRKTEEYFTNLLTKVPSKGLNLEIGLEDDNAELSETNMPLNVEHFVIYRAALKHPHLAMNQDEAEKNPIKKFFIHDSSETNKISTTLNKTEDAALKAYFDFKDDAMKIDQILAMLGYDVRKMTSEGKTNKLKDLSKRDPSKGEEEQRTTLEKFIAICNDKDLAVKYLIHELVGAQVLEKVGTNILIKESGKQIGENLQDAVLYLTNPKNSKDFNVLRAQYDNIVKKDNNLTIEA